MPYGTITNEQRILYHQAEIARHGRCIHLLRLADSGDVETAAEKTAIRTRVTTLIQQNITPDDFTGQHGIR